MDPLTIAWLAIQAGKLVESDYSNITAGVEAESQLTSEYDVPLWKKGVALVAGPGIGPRLYKHWAESSLEKQRKQEAAIGRKAANEDIQSALTRVNEATRQSVNRQLADALARADIRYAQVGSLRTGGRLKEAGRMERAASADIATATAQSALQAQQLTAQIQESMRNYDLAVQQLNAQAQAQEAQQITQIASVLAPMLISKLGSMDWSQLGLGTQQTTTSPGLTSTWDILKDEEKIDWGELSGYQT